MKAWVVVFLTLTIGAAALVARQDDDRSSLRQRIEGSYDVVPLSDGVALRPRASSTRLKDVRLIEIAGGTISINGSVVTGSELRERVGPDAQPILRLSYFTADEQRALFAKAPEGDAAPASKPETADPAQIPLERADSDRPESEQPSTERRARRAHGDRVRIFGDVTVQEDEEITGQVVAVFGSVRVDGIVGDQVVAVMGSVNLGPSAVVKGDVVSVGGRVRRAATAQVHAGVTEVSLANAGIPREVGPWFDEGGPFLWFGGFGAFPKLLGSGFRALLLLLLTGIALVVAGRSVEASAERVSDNPVKATLIGLVAEILIPPVLVLTAIVLAISIIGIPLLLLLPFLVLFLLLMALVGFAGTAAAIGRGVQRRFSLGSSSAGTFVSIAVGILVILSPLLLGRFLALAGWPATPFALLLVAAGFAVELLAWSSGFGAVLTNAFTRVQAHRARAAS